MTPQEINTAVAEFIGWEWKEVLLDVPSLVLGTKKVKQMRWVKGNQVRLGCPNFTEDLNAMHEAEKLAGPEVIKAMRFYLYEICGQMTSHHATAAQRAEAFLRAIGKWKELKLKY